MATNPLLELQKLGQSIWYDNIRRSLILTGDLEAKIEGDGLRGVTSNPAIFEKAIAGSTDYNESLKDLAKQGRCLDGRSHPSHAWARIPTRRHRRGSSRNGRQHRGR